MADNSLAIAPVFSLGPLDITSTVVTSWVITAALALFGWLVSRRLQPDPGPLQTAIEGIVLAIEDAVTEVAPQYVSQLLPFVGSLWIFLVIANLVGLVPGFNSPTRDLSATAALASLVFLSTHWFGIRIRGFRGYLRHYLTPSPILLPFNLISEITRTVALAVRLFGNMMSLEMAALLILMVAGFLAPVPILMLHIIEALVQAYIFGMLALIYVAGGIQSQH
ncbi:F0F1 ATP synthase subunit A [Marinobacter santoriniensis NKSG1]|uniref:ATP synthase subunit a n=1 Tax=Marinobacter santoriniensis NKSG1 TaxID=1288826 RepID=M7CWG1_9GAMM|nr:F0F1 ATP synthase subunit A [Marinobacter santoriniensis]EMP57449.1 F0F1 ATP synthase subunit A [Marinobacter santoriniensis NKSG1]